MDGRPYFVPPFRAENTGVDFLGLRQANLELVYQFIPGINNVTKYVRPYSMLCWAAWAFAQQMASENRKSFGLGEFRAFREKVEILFNWSHRIAGTQRGLVGSDSKPPSGKRGRVPLSFEGWSRNVSWLDAVNYGPSIKADSGLGLAVSPRPGLIAVTPEGKELALALNERMQRCEAMSLFRPSVTLAREAEAAELHDVWNVDKPTSRERAAFRGALFEGTSQAPPELAHARSMAKELIELVLGRSREPMIVSDVREYLTRGLDPAGRPLTVPESLAAHLRLWQVLQIRQIQRLAHEALFSWMERKILVERVRESETLANDATRALDATPELASTKKPAENLKSYSQWARRGGGTLIAGYGGSKLDLIALGHRIEQDLDEASIGPLPNEVFGRCVVALVGCAVATHELAGDKNAKRHLEAGGRPRVSLAHWTRYLDDRKAYPWFDFLQDFIETYLLSQHLATATRRQEQGKQRLRIAIEQEGLVPLIHPNLVWHPVRSPDRLDSFMSLMADCGVLQDRDGGYALP